MKKALNNYEKSLVEALKEYESKLQITKDNEAGKPFKLGGIKPENSIGFKAKQLWYLMKDYDGRTRERREKILGSARSNSAATSIDFSNDIIRAWEIGFMQGAFLQEKLAELEKRGEKK